MEPVTPELLFELDLIRHGESEGNLAHFAPQSLVESQDPLLTEKGFAQAEALGRYLADTPFDAVLSSGLMRAFATAAETAKRQPQNKTVQVMPLLNEIWVQPEYKGQSLPALRNIYPDAAVCPGFDPEGQLIVNDEGEDESKMFMRAGAVMDWIKERFHSGEKLALFSHAGFLTYIIFYIIGYRDAEPFYDFRLSNTGITRIFFYKEGTNKYGDVVFDCVNERCHLN